MFNPHEAKEDLFAQRLAIMFFAIMLVLVSLFFHYDTALKYLLLSSVGETAPGKIVALEHAPLDLATVERRKRENPRNFLKNAETWTKGDTVVIDFRPGDAQLHTIVVRLPANLVDKKNRDPIDVTYLPVNPKIAFPADFLSSFAFDTKIFLGSLIIGLIVLWSGIDEVRAWHSFREKMHRY